MDCYSSHATILQLQLLQSANNRHVLDVGAAHGYLAAALQARGFHVTAIEGNPDLAREAANHCEEVIVADLDGAIPGLKGEFDVILYGDVLEHLKNPAGVLRSINQSLKADGIVIVSLPNIANLYVRMHLLLGKFNYQDRGILDRTHLRFFTRETFRELLDEAELEVLELRATPIPLPLVVPERHHGVILSAIHSCNNWVATHWPTVFGYQFIAVARKRRSLEA